MYCIFELFTCHVLMFSSFIFCGGKISVELLFCAQQPAETKPSCIIYRPVMDPDHLSARNGGLAWHAELLHTVQHRVTG